MKGGDLEPVRTGSSGSLDSLAAAGGSDEENIDRENKLDRGALHAAGNGGSDRSPDRVIQHLDQRDRVDVDARSRAERTPLLETERRSSFSRSAAEDLVLTSSSSSSSLDAHEGPASSSSVARLSAAAPALPSEAAAPAVALPATPPAPSAPFRNTGEIFFGKPATLFAGYPVRRRERWAPLR